MSVIPFTLFISLLLTGVFIFLFARSQRRRQFASAEGESLLPLAGEQSRQAAPHPPVQAPDAHEDHEHGEDDDHHDHDHADGSPCGCRSGKRAPCAGCLKRTAPAVSFPR